MREEREALFVRLTTSPVPDIALDQMEELLPDEVSKEDRAVGNMLVVIVSTEVLFSVMNATLRRIHLLEVEHETLRRRYLRAVSYVRPVKIVD